MGSVVKNRPGINWLWTVALLSEPSFALSISPITDCTINQPPVFDSASAVKIPLNIQSSIECEHIRAVLVQRATALAKILDEHTIDDCTPDNRSEIPFSFTVPNVACATRFAWDFQNCAAEQNCVSFGEVNFVALPEGYP
jgi:hypothetical protein